MNLHKKSQIYFCLSLILAYILMYTYIIYFSSMNIDKIISAVKVNIDVFYEKAEVIAPLSIQVIAILVLWAVISYGAYRATMYIFWKFNIVDLINNIWEGFEENTTKIVDKNPDDNGEKEKELSDIKEKKKKIWYDRITAKAFSYYIFLLFFRWAIVTLWIIEVEQFMNDLIGYLPSLFIWIIIWFFGLRFANSVHDIIYQALELTKDKTSRIIAMWAKLIIMFFTLMIMLNYIKIVDQFIINALFMWFITTLTISLWLAFGLWGKDIAREILESFRK